MLQQLILNGIIAGSIYALIALGFAVVYRTVKFFHFAHGVVYTAGAYLAFSVVSRWLLVVGKSPSVFGWILASSAGILGAGILGALIDRLVYFPLRKKKALIWSSSSLRLAFSSFSRILSS